jgi:hypothetical protein
MSILSALKTQTNSLDDLAALPQAMIMQMAQKGQIRQDMLAPILARKAEMAEASARSRALQGQGGQQPTVMERIMQTNAQAEAPMDSREMGVANLPIREDMYDEQRMAGGGIVAFSDNPNQPIRVGMPGEKKLEDMTEEERAEYIKNNAYLQRSQALSRAPVAFAEFLKEYNPVTGSKFREGVADFFKSDGMSTYEKGRKAKTGEIPMFLGNQPTEKGKMVAEGKMTPDQNLQEVKNREKRATADAEAMAKFDEATALYEKERAAKLAGAKKDSGNVTGKKDVKTAETAKEDYLSKYEKMIMDAGEAAKGARDEAKWMRLAEAGLGIASGDSPYAFSNLKGALPGLRGYGEDIRDLRKEDRARIKDLFEIQKERADVANKEKMLEVQRLAATKPSGVAELAQLYRTDPELARLVQGQGKAGIMTFEEAYKIVATDLKNASLSDAEKVQKARDLMAASSGGGASAATVLNYVPGKGVK